MFHKAIEIGGIFSFHPWAGTGLLDVAPLEVSIRRLAAVMYCLCCIRERMPTRAVFR